ALVGADQAAYQERLARAASRRGISHEDMEKRFVDNGLLVGTADRAAETVAALAEAGVERIYVQWLDLSDLDGMRETMTVVRDG
ncbi:MAG TPA: hypothetical protein VFT85_08300, partial [Acidimicrobiia bacterium]|nr:hypothetical protein [Acidimicrobiia bacterium]